MWVVVLDLLLNFSTTLINTNFICSAESYLQNLKVFVTLLETTNIWANVALDPRWNMFIFYFLQNQLSFKVAYNYVPYILFVFLLSYHI